MFKKLSAIGLFAALILWPQSEPLAQGAGAVVTPTIVVLDIGAIRRDAASVKSIRDQIVTFQEALQGDIQKEQEALSAAQQDLCEKTNTIVARSFCRRTPKI